MTDLLEIMAPREGWPVEAVDAVDALLAKTTELRRENAQLREALVSRIAIEQAKGVLAERYRVLPDEAFEALRRGARNEGRKIHDVANAIVREPTTPAAVVEAFRRRTAT